MLKQRIITALILGPLALWSVLTFSHTAIAIEFAIVLMIAAWEWARLAGIQSQLLRITYSLFVGIVMAATTWYLHEYYHTLIYIIYFVSAWWVFALGLIIVIDKRHEDYTESVADKHIYLNLFSGLVILLGSFVALTGIHQAPEYGAKYILVLFLFIWVADSAAYFTGKAFGKHKLAPHVSPGKTWEGVAGGIVASMGVAYIVTLVFDLVFPQSIYFLIIAAITVAFSVVGDLMESLFKRRAGMKDSSHLLPGHGGFLDRLDSMMAAAPLFLLGLLVAGI